MTIPEFFLAQDTFGLADFNCIWDAKYAKIATRPDDHWIPDSRIGCLEFYLDACNTRSHVPGAVSVLSVAIKSGIKLRLKLNTSSLLMRDTSLRETLMDGHGSMNDISIYVDDEPSSALMLANRDWLRIISAAQFSVSVVILYFSREATSADVLRTRIDIKVDPYEKSITFKRSSESRMSLEAGKAVYRQLVSYMKPSRLSIALCLDFIPRFSSNLVHLDLSDSTIRLSGIYLSIIFSAY
jgi:hypothetical protein